VPDADCPEYYIKAKFNGRLPEYDFWLLANIPFAAN